MVLDGISLCDDDGQLRLAAIRSRITGLLGGVPELRRILYRPGLLAGPPLWIDDPRFHIDRPVNHVELSPPADEHALLQLTENLMAPLLERSHPLWRIWFVTGLPNGRMAAVVALHHAVADGLAAVRLLTALLDPGTASAAPPWVSAARPRRRALTLDNLRTRLAMVRRIVRVPRQRRFRVSWRSAWLVLANAWDAPRTSLNGPIGSRLQLAMIRLDLAAVRQLAHRHGGTVNDVVLDLAAGRVRALLRSRGESVENLVVNAAVSITPHHAEQGPRTGNRAGIVVVKLPLDEPDPAVRHHHKSGWTPTATPTYLC